MLPEQVSLCQQKSSCCTFQISCDMLNFSELVPFLSLYFLISIGFNIQQERAELKGKSVHCNHDFWGNIFKYCAVQFSAMYKLVRLSRKIRHLNSNTKVEKQTNRQTSSKPTPCYHGALLVFIRNRFLWKKCWWASSETDTWAEREGIMHKPEQRRWRRRISKTKCNESNLPLTEFTLSYLVEEHCCANTWALNGQGVL